jgi:hypothetical protein
MIFVRISFHQLHGFGAEKSDITRMVLTTDFPERIYACKDFCEIKI